MRDDYAPFKHTFANLYYDRQRLMDMIAPFNGKPFRIYDWRAHRRGRPVQAWEDYTRISRQSRYCVSTGGLHNAGLPKFLEYACLGVPMIGRKTPFEFPWLDDCLFEMDAMRLSPGQIKPLLDEALERWPILRENCLKWRDQLFKLYDTHRLVRHVTGAGRWPANPAGVLAGGRQQNAACLIAGLCPPAGQQASDVLKTTAGSLLLPGGSNNETNGFVRATGERSSGATTMSEPAVTPRIGARDFGFVAGSHND